MDCSKTLLDWVSEYPEAEAIIREYDHQCECCLLCQCLFDSIDSIEQTYHTDLQRLRERLQALAKDSDK